MLSSMIQIILFHSFLRYPYSPQLLELRTRNRKCIVLDIQSPEAEALG